jgi:hypothetical protein
MTSKFFVFTTFTVGAIPTFNNAHVLISKITDSTKISLKETSNEGTMITGYKLYEKYFQLRK